MVNAVVLTVYLTVYQSQQLNELNILNDKVSHK